MPGLNALVEEIETIAEEQSKKLEEETNKPDYKPSEIVLGAPARLEYKDGYEIPGNIWESVLGEELYDLWFEILTEPGDKITVKGSSVNKILFGIYPKNRHSGKIPKTKRSDVDIIVDDETIKKRIADIDLPKTETTLATQIDVHGIKVDLVDVEKEKKLYQKAVLEVAQWAETLPDSEPFYSESHIDLGNSKQEIIQQAKNLQKKLEIATTNDILTLGNYAIHESFAIELERQQDGSLKATLKDPTGILGQKGIESPVTQIENQIYKSGTYFGITFEDALEYSVPALLMKAITRMEQVPVESKAFMYAINTVPRSLRAATELDITLKGDPFPSPMGDRDRARHFALLAEVAQKMTNEVPPFLVPKRMFSEQELDMGIDTPQKWFVYKMQMEIARSCANNPEKTFEDVLLSLGIAKIISPRLQKEFEALNREFKKWLGANTNMIWYYVEQEKKIPPFKSFAKYVIFEKFIGNKYGMKRVNLENENLDEPEIGYIVYETFPKEMNELISILLVCMEWDPEIDKKDIQELVENWKPQGTINQMWKTSTKEFQRGLDIETLTEMMIEFKQEYEEFIAKTGLEGFVEYFESEDIRKSYLQHRGYPYRLPWLGKNVRTKIPAQEFGPIRTIEKNPHMGTLDVEILTKSRNAAFGEFLAFIQNFLPKDITNNIEHKTTEPTEILEFLHKLTTEKNIEISIILDNAHFLFENNKISQETIEIIYTLKRVNPMKISFVFIMASEIYKKHTTLLGRLEPLFLQNIVFGKDLLFDKESAQLTIEKEEININRKFSDKFKDIVIKLCDIDPFCLRIILKKATTDTEFEKQIENTQDIETIYKLIGTELLDARFNKIISVLNKESIEYLLDRNEKTPTEFLLDTGLVRENTKIVLNELFEYYIENNKKILTPKGNTSITENLSGQELLVFELLEKNLKKVVNKEDIAKILWGKEWEEKYSDWAIDQLMSRIRKKIENKNILDIKTIKDKGYRISKI